MASEATAVASEPREADLLVKMVNIVKRFPGVLANDHVNFELRPGEVHALLGENGAGKTTLMNILYGIYHPDGGEIYVKGRRVEIRSPRDAMSLGIGMVHQHFMLVDRHTVAENIALGYARSLLNPLKEIKEKLREFAEKYGLKVDPDAYIWQLSAGEQQRVEIIKALYHGADILILDEPTSVLTPQETKELFKIIKRMRDEGKGIIFITHKLDEVFEVADRVTVMRRGKVVGTLKASETTKEELARMMVGREVLFRLEKEPVERGKPVLEVENLHALNDRGLPAVRGVSFRIHEGEIFGIAGVAGNGQRELAEVIVGLRKATAGRILIDGVDVTNKSPRFIASRGVAHIPEERLRHGIVPNLSVAENLILKDYYKEPYRRGLLLDHSKVVEDAERLINKFDIVTPSPLTPAKLLSGGNIQRLICARELHKEPRLIVAAHPTYGLDVGATEYIRKILLEQRKRGAAVLLISEDLEEVLQLSDRVGVMFNGEIVGIVRPEKVAIEEIGLMMAGAKRMAREEMAS